MCKDYTEMNQEAIALVQVIHNKNWTRMMAVEWRRHEEYGRHRNPEGTLTHLNVGDKKQLGIKCDIVILGETSGQNGLKRILTYLCLFPVCLKSLLRSVPCLPLFLFSSYYKIFFLKQETESFTNSNRSWKAAQYQIKWSDPGLRGRSLGSSSSSCVPAVYVEQVTDLSKMQPLLDLIVF